MIKEFNPFFLKKILFRLKKILNTKVSSNIIWLIFDKIFRISLSFFVGIFVARYLGPENFGILNYAIALVGVFGSFATGGLTDVSIKEILKGGNKNIILGSIFWLQIILSTLVILPITTMAFISSNDNAQEPLIILLRSLLSFYS
jgi:O-antigen/teichoic acid export membrane protein